MSNTPSLNRRNMMLGLGATAVGGVAIASAGVRAIAFAQGEAGVQGAQGEASDPADAAPRPLQLPAPDAEVRALFGPLTRGSAIASHWELASYYGVRSGGIPVVLAPSGENGTRFAVEIFRDVEGGPEPLARANGLALFLVNHGDGATPTQENHGLGVRALAQVLGERRTAGAPIPSQLRTYRARMALPRSGTFDVPLR